MMARKTTHRRIKKRPKNQVVALSQFGRAILFESMDEGWVDIDGLFIQDYAEHFGLISLNEKTSPCDEDCLCFHEFGIVGDSGCYQLAQGVRPGLKTNFGAPSVG